MDTIAVTARFLRDLEQRRFYGGFESKFEAGHVVLIQKSETIKPDDCRDNRGKYNE